MARRVLCTSTTGDSAVTVTVSAISPTLISASILTTPVPDTRTSSRFKVANPASVNVTVYVPGCRLSIRYCPAASVVAVRIFSISTGLDAAMVTPGSTAPEGPLTVPAKPGCASASEGKIISPQTVTSARTTRRIRTPLQRSPSADLGLLLYRKNAASGMNIWPLIVALALALGTLAKADLSTVALAEVDLPE